MTEKTTPAASVLPLELADLVARAEDHPETISPVDAFGDTGLTPSVVVLRDKDRGMRVEDLLPAAKARLSWAEERAPHPLARRGTAKLLDLPSFVAWANRFKASPSAIFATPEKMVAVVDYHGPAAGGSPGHQRHRGEYAFPYSAEWKFWASLAGKTFTQAQLAEIIEDHIEDLVQPDVGDGAVESLLGFAPVGPSSMLQLAKGISVRASIGVKNAVSLTTGETVVSYDEQHETSAKDGSRLTVPGGFVVAIPVYEGGARWRLTVRLRYRLSGQSVVWLLAVHRADAALREAYDEVLTQVAKDTALPVFRGTPEA